MAAPMATTSSGFTPLDGFLPKNFSTCSWMTGIRVEPPTRITSSISEVDNPASFKAFATGSIERFTKVSANCSNFARVNVFTMCFGPLAVAVMYGKLISVCEDEDNSIFAFSAASFKRCKAIGSLRKSTLSSLMNSLAIQSMITWSKSSPPKWVSPLVDNTSNTPSPNSRMEISKVPPPKSYTAIFWSLPALSKP